MARVSKQNLDMSGVVVSVSIGAKTGLIATCMHASGHRSRTCCANTKSTLHLPLLAAVNSRISSNPQCYTEPFFGDRSASLGTRIIRDVFIDCSGEISGYYSMYDSVCGVSETMYMRAIQWSARIHS